LATIAAASVLGSLSCSTTQPTSAGPQVVAVTASAFGLVQVFLVYEKFEDVSQPPDGVPDLFRAYECVPQNQFVSVSIPWPYSAEAAVIRAGTVDEIIVAASEPFSNLTPYDTATPQPVSDLAPSPPFYFINGVQTTTASPFFLERCRPGVTFEPSNILGQPVVFEFELAQGDTFVFRARKQLIVDASPYAQIPLSVPDMTANFFVDGRQVTPSGTTSDSQDGGGFTASVSTR
jgi:hypothetical protein